MQTYYMPDGKPAPYVMTAQQAAEFLQIESGNPDETLRNYRQTGRLRGTQISKHVRYLLPDLLRFLELQGEKVAR